MPWLHGACMQVRLQAENEVTQKAIGPGFKGITDYIFGREPPPDAGPIARASPARLPMASSHGKRDKISASKDGEAHNRALCTSSGAGSGAWLSLCSRTRSNAAISARGDTGSGPSQSAAVNSEALTVALGPSGIDLEQSSQSHSVTGQGIPDKGAELQPHMRRAEGRTETAPQTDRMRPMFQFL